MTYLCPQCGGFLDYRYFPMDRCPYCKMPFPSQEPTSPPPIRRRKSGKPAARHMAPSLLAILIAAETILVATLLCLLLGALTLR